MLLERGYIVKGTIRYPGRAPGPSCKGTLNVLGSCSRASALKQVVVTSSVTAISYSPNRPSVVDESVWSDLDINRNNKAAWDYAKKHNLDLVVINPGGVFGPVLQDSLSVSNEVLLNILNDTTKVFPNQAIGVMRVKDVSI